MYEVTQLRSGMIFEENGSPYRVLSYDHTKMGRGSATVKVKVRNILTGSVQTLTYQSGKRVAPADVETVSAVYKYRTNKDYIFEGDDDYELPLENATEEGKYLLKNMSVQILLYKNEPIGVNVPIKGTYVVKEAPPDARGNSANASTKEVVLENNLTVKTPMFIKDGDQIVVDTRTGTYVSRA